MNRSARRVSGAVAAAALALVVVSACSDDNSDDKSAASSDTMSMSETSGAQESGSMDSASAGSVDLTAADGTTVTLTGPIAAKYSSATESQKNDLGAPRTGADTSGTESNGVMFQQFDGGVITAKNGDTSTPAYITWGKIRDAWNVPRNADGQPAADGKGGSQGPLGIATSDETDENGVKTSTFEHGKITWTQSTDQVEVTVDGKVVPTS